MGCNITTEAQNIINDKKLVKEADKQYFLEKGSIQGHKKVVWGNGQDKKDYTPKEIFMTKIDTNEDGTINVTYYENGNKKPKRVHLKGNDLNNQWEYVGTNKGVRYVYTLPLELPKSLDVKLTEKSTENTQITEQLLEEIKDAGIQITQQENKLIVKIPNEQNIIYDYTQDTAEEVIDEVKTITSYTKAKQINYEAADAKELVSMLKRLLAKAKKLKIMNPIDPIEKKIMYIQEIAKMKKPDYATVIGILSGSKYGNKIIAKITNNAEYLKMGWDKLIDTPTINGTAVREVLNNKRLLKTKSLSYKQLEMFSDCM